MQKVPASQIAPDAIMAELEKILSSQYFVPSRRSSMFLRFVVEETLAGRAEQLIGYTIGMAVCERDENFDPQTDPIVRIEAGRLRRRLEHYYQTDGRRDQVLIEIPKGSYVPQFKLHKTLSNKDRQTFQDDLSPSRADEITAPFEPKIAVLPFTNIGDPQDEFFADGLTEELTTALSQFEGTLVIARHSTMRYKKEPVDVRQIGVDLDVRFILEGSVRRDDNKIRITAQLLDALTGGHLWAQKFDRDLSVASLFSIQDEITSRVSAKIASPYGVIERTISAESSQKRTSNFGVYEAILRFHHYDTALTQESYEEAREALERAVELDPRCSQAWASLAEIYWEGETLGFSKTKNIFDKAETCSKRAIALDPMCQVARWTMVLTHLFKRNRKELLREAEKVIELNPNAAYMKGMTGWTVAMVGEWNRGLDLIESSIDLNPYYPGWFHIAFSLNYFRLGEYGKALAEAEKVNVPGLSWGLALRAAALALLGRASDAKDLVDKLISDSPNFTSEAQECSEGHLLDDAFVMKFLKGLDRYLLDDRVMREVLKGLCKAIGLKRQLKPA